MKKKNLFIKIVFIVLIALLLLSLIVPVIFSQTAPKKETLLNGLKVLMWSDAKADKVSVKIRIHSGSAFDPQGKEGVMQMLSDNLFPNEAAREFFAEDLGGGLEVVTNYDYIQINASAKPDQFLTMLETLADAVSNPPIDKENTTKLRNVLAAKVKALESDPAYVADQAVAKRLFGTFPYGRPQFGTEASLQKLEYPDLVEARQRFLTADNATIAVTGNVDRSLALRAIKRYFGGWLKADKKVPATFRQPDDPPTAMLTVESPTAEVSAIRFAFRGISRSDKDFAAATVFTEVLEARLRSRVPAASAEKLFARNEAHILPGWIVVGFSAIKDNLGGDNGRAGPIDLTKALADAITDAEFSAARSTASTEWTKRDVAQFWLDSDTYKTVSADADRKIFEVLTLADVRSFAEKTRSATWISVLMNTPK